MTPKELKDTLRFEAESIQRYRERIERLRTVLEYSVPGAERVQGGSDGTRLPDTVNEIIRLEGLMQAEIDRIWEYLVFCDAEIQRDVLKLRYIEWRRWEKIALEVKYSEQHIYRVHWKAMRVICKKLSTLPKRLHES